MVDYRCSDNIAILEVRNPPVNALSHLVRQQLQENLDKAVADGGVDAVVVCGKGSFLAGADIREFGTGAAFSPPRLVEVCDLLEACSKPVVAAISGFALGGGLEVAISCHYRVALDNTKFGFPEVDIGILPAASGTQRYPRLCGMKAALDIIPTGRRIGAKEAKKIGLLDKIVSGDVAMEGVKFAKSVSKRPLSDRRASKRSIPDRDQAVALQDASLRKAKQKSPGILAPIYCIKSVMAAIEFPFEKGMEKEMEYSAILFSSAQSRALQYAFFAERSAPKWKIPGANFKTVQPQPVKSGGIIGGGTMGSGIAMAMLNAGITVTLVEKTRKDQYKAVAAVRSLYEGSVKLGKMTDDQAKLALKKFKPTVKFEDLSKVDVVIEAVFENMELKKQVFTKLDKICKPEAMLWSNTSGLDIDQIASVTSRPDRVMGTHFFAPAYYMRLVENIRGAKTSPQTIATAMHFGTKIGKIPVLVGNCHGFVGNRMQYGYSAEAGFLVEEGALPHEVDQVMEDLGMTMGPFKVGDLSGLDIGWSVRKESAKAAGVEFNSRARFTNGARTTALGNMLCENGRLGRKSGKGWYRYDKPGAKTAYVDPDVTDLILRFCQEEGIERRKITPQEVTERCFYPLINEGFKLLEEGIASKPEDIDTIWLHGYGWPRQTGGPMHYATQVGLGRIYNTICQYYEKYPSSPHWQPSDLLRRLAEQEVPLKDWVRQTPHSNL